MPAPLKVLFLLEDLCFGGTQTQNLELASRLDRDRFSPALLTLTGPTDMDEKAKAANIPLFHLGSTRARAPLFFLRLKGALKKIKPDILVPCTALPNIWGRIWGRFARIPVIVGTCRGGGAPARQHERLLWRFCDGIVCNSAALATDMAYIGVPEGKLAYIPNGVDTNRFRPALKKFTGEEALILHVARLAKDKDQKTLLKSFAIVNEIYPETRLRIVGEGPEEKALKNFAEKELSDAANAKVEFAGASADPASHYAEADVFAFSSIREGMPNAILEAMSCGLPICATDAGGIPALVEGAGLVSPVGDAEGLANNILTFLRAPGMAAHMGANGRRKAAEEHSYDVMVEAHQNLFLRLFRKKGMPDA